MLHAGLRTPLEPAGAPLRTPGRSARMAVVTERYVQALHARSDVGRRLEITTTLGDGYQAARRGA
jgi:hypothetical protein